MDALQAEVEKLRQELAEVKEKLQVTEQTLQAIQEGEIDALVISNETGMQVFTLQRADYTYQLLVEQMGEGAATIDDNGLILYCNQRLSDLLNCPLENLIGSYLQTFIDSQYQQAFLSILNQILIGKIITVELSLITLTDQREIAVQLSLKRYQIDQIIVNSVVITDITQRKQTEIALQEAQNTIKKQEEQLRLALEFTETGTWDWDVVNNLFFWNASLYTLLGYQPWQYEASYEIWRCLIHPDDVIEVERKLRQALENHSDYEAEYRIIWQDGSIHWLLGKGRGIYDESGQALHMIGTLSEITERKIAELNQQFLSDLDLRLRHLNSAEEMLGEAIKSIGEYLQVERVVWHEVNVDEDISYVTQDWRRDANITSVVGNYRLSDNILPELIELYRAGKPAIVSDVANYSYTAPFAHNFAKMDVRSFVGVPCIHEGKWVAVLAINSRTPQNWQPQQVALLQETAKRLWPMIAETKAIQALHQEQQKLSLFIKYAPVSVAMFDQNMSYLEVSQRWLEMYQLGEREEVIGRSHYELLNVSERWRQLHQQGLAGIASKCEEDRYILPDGSEQWLKWEIQPWRFHNGEIGGILIFVENITERKQAEIALQEAQNTLNMAIEAAQMGTWYLDIVNDISSVRSLRHDQIFGYDTPQIEWGAAIARKHILEADREIWDAAFARARETGELQFEVRVRWSDGSIHWMAAHGRFYFDDNGNPIYAAGVNLDISERKQAEIILREREQLKREQLVNNIAQSIRETLDLEEVLQRTVDQVRELLKADRVIIFYFQPDWTGTVITESVINGFPVILGSNISDPCLSEKYLQPYLQGKITMRTDLDTEDIEPCYKELMRPFQVKAYLAIPILNNQLWGFLIIHQCSVPRQWQDSEINLVKQLSISITIAIKQAELYQKIAEQAALIDIATDAIFVQDLANQIIFWNKGAERLYGWTEAEVLGQKSQDLFNQGNEQREALETTIKQGYWEGELEQITKNGKKIIVESHRTLVTNQLSKPQSILIVNSNITEKKQLEKQFYHAQRLESLGTLASGIAHDFNNILTPILGVSQLLSLHFPNLDEKTERLLTLLTSSAKRGADLVKQILLFSRQTEGNLITLQLGYLLLELIGIIQHTFPKSITIQSEIPTRELWTIYADATQMHQVFMNLAVNARDAMPEGGILTITAENYQLDDSEAMLDLAAKADSYVVVTIADTGMGMNPEILERIFDPFFTTKETGKGTGLGLATVMGIIKSHNGFIKVNSELGKGTQFKIFLPALKEDIDVISTEEIIPKGNGELILIVDDETTIQEVTKITLENYNYRTIVASDGQEALTIYREQSSAIKVIILDMMMPNLDGIKAIHALQEINPQVKIIATSGLITNRKLALEANVKNFLGKPYTNKQLLKALTEITASQSEIINQIPSENIILDSENLKTTLAQMSPHWLQQMYQASYAVDADLMLELVEQIPNSEKILINTLKHLVNDFQTDLIMELTGELV